MSTRSESVVALRVVVRLVLRLLGNDYGYDSYLSFVYGVPLQDIVRTEHYEIRVWQIELTV